MMSAVGVFVGASVGVSVGLTVGVALGNTGIVVGGDVVGVHAANKKMPRKTVIMWVFIPPLSFGQVS
jgi:hypothetical protein